jgi:hypothetical protein
LSSDAQARRFNMDEFAFANCEGSVAIGNPEDQIFGGGNCGGGPGPVAGTHPTYIPLTPADNPIPSTGNPPYPNPTHHYTVPNTMPASPGAPPDDNFYWRRENDHTVPIPYNDGNKGTPTNPVKYKCTNPAPAPGSTCATNPNQYYITDPACSRPGAPSDCPRLKKCEPTDECVTN